jgi:hypothetical protein
MKRLLFLTVVSTFIVGTAGCRQCNWFGRPSCAATTPTYSAPAMQMAPATSPPSCGPGCNSCGSNSLPMLSDPQSYVSTPTN